jgi:hypothetical protein
MTMPNWCSNYISVSHEDQALLEKFVNAAKDDTIASTFLPEPDFSEECEPGTMSDSQYNWRLANWGTKWDFGIENISQYDNEVFGYAETAWSPPVEVFIKLYELGFTVDAMWHEGGMGLAGRYQDGNLDEYNNIEYTEDYLNNDIDEDIVEAFNLYDMIPEEELS